jgi:DNA-binding MarR family transcriptional regulator
MNDELKQNLLHALYCFKRTNLTMYRPLLNNDDGGLSVTEIFALGCIRRCGEEDCNADQTTHHAMHETLSVSKAAVSQMLGSLEKRGYIRREIDHDNRRRIIITLTEQGETTVNEAEKKMDVLMSRIITRFGEKDTRNFTRLLERFVEVVDESVKKTG